jgi:hypothetical protein
MIQFPTAEKRLAKVEGRIAKANLKQLKKVEDQLLIATDKTKKFVDRVLSQIGERRAHLLEGQEVSDVESGLFAIVCELDPKSLESNFRSRIEAIRDRVLTTQRLDSLSVLNPTQLSEILRHVGG